MTLVVFGSNIACVQQTMFIGLLTSTDDIEFNVTSWHRQCRYWDEKRNMWSPEVQWGGGAEKENGSIVIIRNHDSAVCNFIDLQ